MQNFRPLGIVRFGMFELDFRTSELRTQGAKIKLQDQPFQILQILLQRPGGTVSREELQQKIWPSDTFVDFDHGLYNAIKRLREALGDSAATPRFVETLSRRGYRFVGKIECEGSQVRSLAVLPLEKSSVWGEHGISRFPCEVLPYVHGVGDRAGSLGTSRDRCLGWGLPLSPTASASRSEILSRLNTRPVRSPVNASTPPSRAAPRDSGPLWFASPSTYETFIHNTSPI
jgi:DNA-binding winged helix-turn-helix (wHTH) protein